MRNLPVDTMERSVSNPSPEGKTTAAGFSLCTACAAAFICRVQVSQLYVLFSAGSLSGERNSLRRPKLESDGHDFDCGESARSGGRGSLTWFAMKLQPRIHLSALNDLSPNHELPSRPLQHHM